MRMKFKIAAVAALLLSPLTAQHAFADSCQGNDRGIVKEIYVGYYGEYGKDVVLVSLQKPNGSIAGGIRVGDAAGVGSTASMLQILILARMTGEAVDLECSGSRAAGVRIKSSG